MKKTFAIFVLLASAASAQIVEGNIVNEATGAGIERVAIHLEPASTSPSDDESYDTITDALGHFVFAHVKVGDYEFSYHAMSLYEPEPPAFPKIHVTAGGEPLKLEGRLSALPAISGHVVDSSGSRVPGAPVAIAGVSARLVAITNSSGEFEMHLKSGSYSLTVTPPPGMTLPDPEPGSDQLRVFTPIYYPGVTVPEAASKLVVHRGEQISVELKLVAVPAHVLHGTLLNRDGTPASGVSVGLNVDEPRGNPAEHGPPTYEARTDAEGAFAFPLVSDGDWRLSAELQSSGAKLRALAWIQVNGHNIDDVNLRLEPPFTLQGRVVMEPQRDGTKEGVAPPAPGVSLIPHAGRVASGSGAASWMLAPETRPGFRAILYENDGAISTEPGRDGVFSVNRIYPGSYRIAPLAAPAGYYLDSVRVGGIEVAASEVQLSPGTPPITIEYKTNGGVVRGVVEKCSSGTVLLIPADANMRWFGYLHSMRCDATDHYQIVDVRPGEYYAVAFAGSNSVPSLDAGVLRQAHQVTVKAGEAVTADLSAIVE